MIYLYPCSHPHTSRPQRSSDPARVRYCHDDRHARRRRVAPTCRPWSWSTLNCDASARSSTAPVRCAPAPAPNAATAAIAFASTRTASTGSAATAHPRAATPSTMPRNATASRSAKPATLRSASEPQQHSRRSARTAQRRSVAAQRHLAGPRAAACRRSRGDLWSSTAPARSSTCTPAV